MHLRWIGGWHKQRDVLTAWTSRIHIEPGEYTVVISGLMEGFGLDSRSVNPHSDQLSGP